MNREDFLQRKTCIQQEIRDLKTEQRELESDYIEANREYRDGERVKITRRAHNGTSTNWKTNEETVTYYPETVRFAFVKEVRIREYNGELEYIIQKEKKDGTPSAHYDYLGSLDILSKI